MTGAPAGLGQGAPRHRTVDDMNTSTAQTQHATDPHTQPVTIPGGTPGTGPATAKAAARWSLT